MGQSPFLLSICPPNAFYPRTQVLCPTLKIAKGLEVPRVWYLEKNDSSRLDPRTNFSIEADKLQSKPEMLLKILLNSQLFTLHLLLAEYFPFSSCDGYVCVYLCVRVCACASVSGLSFSAGLCTNTLTSSHEINYTSIFYIFALWRFKGRIHCIAGCAWESLFHGVGRAEC